MPGTLIHEPPEAPPPATVPDPALTAGAARRSRGWLWALLALAFLVLGGAGAGAYVYFVLWKYERTAARHLPSNTVAAFRVEASEFLLFAPVRKHIWPVLEERTKAGGKNDTRLRLIQDKTGVDLERDVREIVVATVDATGYVVLLGGPFERGRVVKVLHSIFDKESPDAWKIDGELLVGPHEIVIAQAEDGTIIIGTNRDVAESALDTSDAHEKIALPEGGAFAFSVTEPAIAGLQATTKDLAGVETRLRASRVAGTMTLGDDPRIEIRFAPRTGTTAAELKGDVDVLVQDARLLLYFAPDLAGEKQVLRDAKIEEKDGGVVTSAAWPYEPLDKGCQRIAEGLRTLFGDV